MKLARRRPREHYRRDLAAFVGGRGPYLSLYLDVRPGQARSTVQERLLAALEGLVRDDLALSPTQWTRAGEATACVEEDDATLVAFVDGAGALLATGYPDPIEDDLVDLSTLPRLGPLLEAEQRLIHHLLVVVEEGQLILATVPRHGQPTETVLEVDDTRSIAAIVHRAARISETRLLVLCAPADDLVWLEPQVRAGLPLEVAVSTVEIDELDDDALAERIVIELSTHAARTTVELMRLWRFHQAHEQTVAGVGAVIDAVGSGRAALVLLDDDQDDTRTAEFAPIPGPDGVSGNGSTTDGPPEVGRWQDVVIRAALLADIPIHIVPDVGATLDDGVGAILDDRVDPAVVASELER